MFSGRFQCHNFRMARFAEFMTRKRDGARSNYAERIGSEVSILAETLRHKKRAGNQKDDDAKNKDGSEPDQMFRILRPFHALCANRDGMKRHHLKEVCAPDSSSFFT